MILPFVAESLTVSLAVFSIMNILAWLALHTPLITLPFKSSVTVVPAGTVTVVSARSIFSRITTVSPFAALIAS